MGDEKTTGKLYAEAMKILGPTEKRKMSDEKTTGKLYAAAMRILAPKEYPTLTEEQKREAYFLALDAGLPFGEPFVMAKLAEPLHEMRVQTGCTKMTDFMLAMPEFITLTDGGKSKMVTLTAVPAWDAAYDAAPRVIAPKVTVPTVVTPKAVASKTQPALTEEQKREAYLIARSSGLPFGDPFAMEKLSHLFHEMRVRIGYAKMIDFMLAMPEFITIVGSGKTKTVTLTAVPAWDAACDAVPAAATPAAAASGAAAPKAVASADPAAAPDALPAPPVAIDGQVFLPEKMLRILNKLIANDDTVPAGPAELAVLKQSYADAVTGGRLTAGADHYLFPTGLTAQNGDQIVASIKPSDREMPWWLNYLGTDGSNSPGKQLERFAYLGDRTEMLQELTDLALDEKWDPGDGKRSILYSYLRFTFYRLKEEGKIAVSADGGLAAFNTGLVNTRYEDIYACFEPNDPGRPQKWRFSQFCVAGMRGLGKQLVSRFGTLPQPAKYFSRMEDLLLDPNKEIYLSYEHIIVDNVDRLPPDFLADACRKDKEALACIDRIRDGESEAYSELRDLICDRSDLFGELSRQIDDAVELARKQVRWNFKTAIPCYFPTRNVMSLMLPLSLVDRGVADVALVVELQSSGNYLGQTILTLPQAYIDARLICRPSSEWLNTESILPVAAAADPDDEE